MRSGDRTGWFALGLALLANPWTLGWFTADGIVTGAADTAFIVLLEALLGGCGLLILWKGSEWRGTKSPAFALLTAALTLAGAELGLQAFVAVSKWAEKAVSHVTKIHKEDLSFFRGLDWPPAMYAEHSRLRWMYHPYAGARRKPFAGEYINIDGRGIRKSWQAADGVDGPRIWMFGGSTMWGTGARDGYTIPSWTARLLHGEGIHAKAVNFGESAYVFTQEVLYLAWLLREREAPDWAVFYDGVNDVYSAYLTGQTGTGTIHRQTREQVDFNTERLPFHRAAGSWAAGTVKEYSMVYRGVAAAAGALAGGGDPPSASFRREDPEALVDGIVNTYMDSMELAKKLAEAYGFEPLFIWQPCLLTEDRVTDEEALADERYRNEELTFLYRTVLEQIRERARPPLYDFSGIFHGREESVYIDFCHVSEAGNRTIAAQILKTAGLPDRGDPR